MSDELVFTVDNQVATPATPMSMLEAGLLEREHLQEWVKAHPAILGEDILLVSVEFDRWVAGDGSRPADSLDVLGLDRNGRLVLAELKRDKAADTVTMQALNYAAMVSRFSLDDLIAVFEPTHQRSNRSDLQALDVLTEWAPGLSDETLGPPRIVLVASDFSATVTNTALFLYESGLDVRLIRYQLYRTASAQVIFTASQLLPVPKAEEFMVRPSSSAQTRAVRKDAGERRAAIPDRLVAAHVFAEGQPLRIVVPAGVAEDRETIGQWLAESPDRSQVTWHADARMPVVWSVDGQAYNLTTLVKKVIELATGAPAQTQAWGPNWFRDGSDRNLAKIADGLS